VFHGEERWASEGIQVGGVGSARGVVGTWFDRYVHLFNRQRTADTDSEADITTFTVPAAQQPFGRPPMQMTRDRHCWMA
jgi:hypothetical protein